MTGARPRCPPFGFARRARDYGDVSSRRFHAEAIACLDCGPHLSHPVATIAEAVTAGRIVALKGIGFHLICDCFNEPAVAELRRRKARGEKPFAIMVANEASAGLIAAPAAAERALLSRSERPVVLMQHRSGLAPSIAPGLTTIGLMLPYAPVHHLLFYALAGSPTDAGWRSRPLPIALVATSGEPLVVEDDDARRRLAGIADLIVTHDRPITARADDSVMAVIDGVPAYVRRSRGFVPEPIDLGEDGPAVIGVGAHLKATVTVTRGREAFVSQHIGDLDNAATIRFHEEAVRHLLDILDLTPEAVACDLHPDFHSTRFAEASGLPVVAVQHHASPHRFGRCRTSGARTGSRSGARRLRLWRRWRRLGRRTDRRQHRRLERLGHLLPLPLCGGDRAARDPWCMGIAALAALGPTEEATRCFPDIPLARPLVSKLLGAPAGAKTTSMGRLFDAAAALLGVRTSQTYEGQAAMALEALMRMPRASARSMKAATRSRTSMSAPSSATETRSPKPRSPRFSNCARASNGGGLGTAPDSGLRLETAYAAFDAERRFDLEEIAGRDNPGCECGAILRGVKTPSQCKLLGTACTPDTPMGSCMVFSEGACAAHWTYSRFRDQDRRVA